METRRARFVIPAEIRLSPYTAGEIQVNSIEDVAQLGDEQKKILYRLAQDLIVLEDIGRPDNIERMQGNPFSSKGIAKPFRVHVH